MVQTPYWHNQTLDEYLYEKFREDKIDRDVEILASLGKEILEKRSGSEFPQDKKTTRAITISICECCPFFEGWIDPVGLPALRCRLTDMVHTGKSTIELYKMIHPGNEPVSVTLKPVGYA